MEFEYCINCEQFRHYDVGGLHIAGSKVREQLCYGPFATSAPQELPEGWQDLVEEPEDEFMLISDANAENLRLQFEGTL